MSQPLWDSEKIQSILPQRAPFLFVDALTEIDGTRKITAVKQVTLNEPFFKGHFPGNPVMPGVLILEAMAQAALLLFAVCKPEIARQNPVYYLGKAKTEFLSPVHPGDTLILEAVNVKITDTAAVIETCARVNETRVAKAELVLGLKLR